MSNALKLEPTFNDPMTHYGFKPLHNDKGIIEETLLATYSLSSAGENQRIPPVRMTQRPGEPNSCLGGEPWPEVENTELYERHGSYRETMEQPDRGLTEAEPHAKRIMETEIWSTRDAEKQGIGIQPQIRNEWEGKYTLKCPAITQEWGYDDRNFSLAVYSSSTSSRLWISFNLGIISGVMRSEEGLPEVGKRILAQWRGREDGGLMTFGYGNLATLTFFGDGNVECDLGGDFRVGLAHFTGSKDKSTNAPVNIKAEIEKLKTEYRNYNRHNYDVANKQKPGGEEDSPYESDTRVEGVAETAGWNGLKRKDPRGKLDDDESVRLMKRKRLEVDMI